MLTRKAILLKYVLNDSEDFKSNLDFGLAKAYLKSSEGGCFSENEIIELYSDRIEKNYLIDSVDYSFIYFSGHSHYFDRKIHLLLSNK